ncbi:hypothetical protein KV557_24380 [Kitasatospora aureofaciens]|uniref:hypothetical protein n=1 Tax=Kitasatospora aureofaciens TaxID=1894 RepID=UPI001C455130|nr:hypothetical protein [Kitasatospora aureofaciens]MBV6700203.1 hypothetical protein [Kitasatospora aureofaciens]
MASLRSSTPSGSLTAAAPGVPVGLDGISELRAELSGLGPTCDDACRASFLDVDPSALVLATLDSPAGVLLSLSAGVVGVFNVFSGLAPEPGRRLA